MYARIGLNLSGVQLRAQISGIEGLSAPTGKINEGWVDGIFALLKKRTGGLAFQDKDIDLIRAHKNVKWFWRPGTDGQPSAYLAYGRGIDLCGIVHEWGGDAQSLKALLADFVVKFPEAQILGNETLFKQAGLKPREPVQEFLCLAKSVKLTEQDWKHVWIWGLDSA
jgi:hypothetical protein